MAATKHYEGLFGHRYFNLLHIQLNLPWLYSVRMVRAAKTLRSPHEYLRRKLAARRVMAGPLASKVKRSVGYWLFNPDELPGTKAAAAVCAAIFHDLQRSGTLHEHHNNKKKHLRALLTGDEFQNYPEVLRFAVSDPVIEAAVGYFGTVPILCSMALFWSVKNETTISSQRYHLDGEDVRQLKLFLNVWDLDDEHGPLTFFPASVTSDIMRHADRNGRLNAGTKSFEDSFVVPSSSGHQPIRLVGKAGTGAFVDTSRCMHYGSRGNSKDRLMLIVQFAPYNLARESAIDLGSTDWLPLGPREHLQRLVLQR
jgi:hypothetical protein